MTDLPWYVSCLIILCMFKTYMYKIPSSATPKIGFTTLVLKDDCVVFSLYKLADFLQYLCMQLDFVNWVPLLCRLYVLLNTCTGFYFVCSFSTLENCKHRTLIFSSIFIMHSIASLGFVLYARFDLYVDISAYAHLLIYIFFKKCTIYTISHLVHFYTILTKSLLLQYRSIRMVSVMYLQDKLHYTSNLFKCC